jgi:predicted RND superfamily exporter protein
MSDVQERRAKMVKFGKWIAKHRILIIIISVLLLIPSFIGMVNTRINYDVLTYLPKDNATVIGQDILTDDFGIGGFSMVLVEGMDSRHVSELKSNIEDVEGVNKVIWYDSLLDISVPMDILPQEAKDFFNKDDSTMMVVLFTDSTSSDTTMSAIKQIRKITGEQAFISGMSAVVEDTKELADSETAKYVGIAVILCVIALALTMSSIVVPLLFMASIGIAVMYNMGTNIIFGEISYITKALAAVLQLAVTMDYSIFLYNSYEENKLRFPDEKERAMGHAISNTLKSVIGSSLTTIAGFAALCFMSFLLGKDIGFVMMKGVVFGVISCVTILPSLILVFDGAIEKTKRKSFNLNLDRLSDFITKHVAAFIILFLVLLVPALFGYNNTDVYYNLDTSLPDSLPSVVANTKLADEYGINSEYMILVDTKLNQTQISKMITKIKSVDGVDNVVGLDTLIGPAVPVSFLPDGAVDDIKTDKYQLEIVSSDYKVATDEMTEQINAINSIVSSYSKDSIVAGEAPLTNDLIKITDHDFKVVSIVSIIFVFLIIAIVFKSISLPVILVAVIEFAIFINMGIPYYTHTTLPFVASIVIGTIQLGSTVDYAILMTSRYEKERSRGAGKKEAVQIAHKASIVSVVMSAFGFFAATFGVGLYSSIDMISSLCLLMARGALISMLVVVFILPAMLYVFDGVIVHTSIGFLPKKTA